MFASRSSATGTGGGAAAPEGAAAGVCDPLMSI
jgi:hypothetical protein